MGISNDSTKLYRVPEDGVYTGRSAAGVFIISYKDQRLSMWLREGGAQKRTLILRRGQQDNGDISIIVEKDEIKSEELGGFYFVDDGVGASANKTIQPNNQQDIEIIQQMLEAYRSARRQKDVSIK